MRVRAVFLSVFLSIIVLAAPAFAQDATLIGTVVDSTKSALPGAAITATMIDTGRVMTDGV